MHGEGVLVEDFFGSFFDGSGLLDITGGDLAGEGFDGLGGDLLDGDQRTSGAFGDLPGGDLVLDRLG